MTVKEMISYLEQCNPDYNVVNMDGTDIECVVQHWELTCENENRVEVY